MKIRELLTYVAGVLLFIISFVAGISTNFWGYIQDPAQVTLASLALSIAVFVVTDRVAINVRDSENFIKITNLVNSLAARIPPITVIMEFPTADDAMRYLCERIPKCKLVLNTKVSRDAIPPKRDVGKSYERAIQAGLRLGLVYKDIISEGFVDYANRLYQYSLDKSGRYEYIVRKVLEPSFLNFIILELETGEQELLIGWATSKTFGLEQPVYKILDPRLISYFKQYHVSLWVRE